jgi:hypothetical protein
VAFLFVLRVRRSEVGKGLFSLFGGRWYILVFGQGTRGPGATILNYRAIASVAIVGAAAAAAAIGYRVNTGDFLGRRTRDSDGHGSSSSSLVFT